jgi:extracellular elastinolytic metalloproteinase
VLALAASSLALDAPTHASPPAAAAASAPAAATHTPLGSAAVQVARAHLASHAADAGLAGRDVADLAVSSVVPTKHNGLTNVYFQQQVDSRDVFNAIINVAVAADGSVVRVAADGVKRAAQRVNATAPKITDVEAARRAAAALHLQPTASFRSNDAASGPDHARDLGDGGISNEAIPARLVYERTAGGDLRLAWELVIDQLDGKHWWQIRMDAITGAELGRADWVAQDTHRVFPMPVEAPSFATPLNTRTLVSNPATSASPFGWNDTNGVAGAESTLTTGNNVNAYTDTDANNLPDPGSQPDGGAGLAFDFPLDLTQAPTTYKPAAVSNLYFTNNRIHDIMHRFGFTEAAGNFQANNYGHGGLGSDAVNAEAQDGGDMNNARFGTGPDGQKPRMQMYLWNTTVPGRDGDLDNGVIAHEYAHGISNRLTGGPATASCLQNNEQAGEGWSDYYSYMLNMPNGTEPAGGRGIGTYVLGQATTGGGIRSKPYSTSLAINPQTYDSIKTKTNEHGVGEVWAEMLWEVTYALIDEYGFNANLDAGPMTAGNLLSLRLVTDGLKLQPCSPGFVTARDAIIAADLADTGGANKCLLWTAFAKRGLGAGASQGSSASITDGTQSFAMPASCLPPATPTVTSTTASVGAATVAFTTNPGAEISSATVECVSTDGGASGTNTGPASPVTVSGLTSGKTYHCRVSVTNAAATSAFSAFGNQVTLPLPPVATAPGAPVITSAKATSPKKAKVSFTLASDGGSPVTSYTVTCKGKKGAKTKSKTGPASPITVKGLTPGKKYTCTVTATNSVGTGPASAKSKKFKMKKRHPHKRAAVIGRSAVPGRR